MRIFLSFLSLFLIFGCGSPPNNEAVSPTVTEIIINPTDTATPLPTDTPASTNTPEPNTKTYTSDLILSRLISLDDMPPGWTIENTATYTITDYSKPNNFLCNPDVGPPLSEGVANISLKKGAFGPFLSERIAIFPSESEAQATFNTMVTTFDQCAGQDWRIEEFTTSVTLLSFPDLGYDNTLTVRVEKPMESDIITVQLDNIIMIFFHAIFPTGVDTAVTEEYVRMGLDKLK
jgi:hypothetical protein